MGSSSRLLSWIYANKLIDAIGSHLLSVYLNGEDTASSLFLCQWYWRIKDIRSWAVQGNHKRHNEKAEFVVIGRRQNLLTQKLLKESDQFRHVINKAYE